MKPTDRETKAAMINDIIADLSETEKIVYLTIYFDSYSWAGLKSLLGLIASNYDKVGIVNVAELIKNKSDKSVEEISKG